MTGSAPARSPRRPRLRRRRPSRLPRPPELGRQPELAPVRAAVDPLQPLDVSDVGPSLRELHADAVGLPAVDVLLACVVGGEREPLVVAVLLQQMVEIPRAV